MDKKEELIETVKRLLCAADMGLDFLCKLEESELKILIASISHRLEDQKSK